MILTSYGMLDNTTDQSLMVGVSFFGSTGTFVSSGNGFDFSSQPAPSSLSGWNSITTDNNTGTGTFLAVRLGRTGAYSSDGISWNTMDLGFNANYRSITYSPGLGRWVVVGQTGNTGVIRSSTDGITWTASTLPSGVTGNFPVVASNNDRFIAGGGDSVAEFIIYSNTGTGTWLKANTAELPNEGSSISGIAYSPSLSRWACVQNAGGFGYSATGSYWTVGTGATSGEFYGLAWSDSQAKFVAVGTSGTVRTSTDGINWTAQSSGLTANLTSVIWNSVTNVWYVTVDYSPGSTGTNGIWRSPNAVGASWSQASLNTLQEIEELAYKAI